MFRIVTLQFDVSHWGLHPHMELVSKPTTTHKVIFYLSIFSIYSKHSEGASANSRVSIYNLDFW